MFLTKFLVSALIIAFVAVPTVSAVTTPDFPACANASGTIISSYPNGIHGIVGRTNTYTGSDVVYQLSESTVMQCFCGPDGQGIQTNWWRASSLSEENIQVLKVQGWHYVPNGSLWGLENDPYMAQNISYNCQPGKPGSNDDPNRAGTGGGDILAASTGDVLGLAATGDAVLVYGTFMAALLFLLIGYTRIRKSRSV